jgi:predicted secreted protein
MPSEGLSGQGAAFERSTDDGSTWTPIANVYNISGPGMSRDIIEITTYDSEGYRDKVGGLRDGGTVTFTMNFTRAQYTLLKDDFDTDDPVDYRIVLPDTDATTMPFKGLVTELPMTIPEGDRITVDVTIEISGIPSIDPVV